MSEAMQPGLLIVYSGPSGVGKGTILAPYLAAHPEMFYANRKKTFLKWH